ERTILVSEGVKGRPIDIEFAPPPAPVVSAPPAPAQAATSAPPKHHLQGFDYALGGVALASLGAFATFSSWALFERQDLQQHCAPFCSDDQVSSVATKLVVADVALGAAVVSLAVLYLHLTRPPDAG